MDNLAPILDPTDLANKSYIDTADALKVGKAGDTMTGPLILSADPVANLEAASRQYITNGHARGAFNTMTCASGSTITPTIASGTAFAGVTVGFTTLTVLRDGYWTISAWMRFSATVGANQRMLSSILTSTAGRTFRGFSQYGDRLSCPSAVASMSAGDTVSFDMYQNTGASMTCDGQFFMKWIGEL